MYIQKTVCKLKIILTVIIFGGAVTFCYFFTTFTTKDVLNDGSSLLPFKKPQNYNVWLIFTKVNKRSPLRYKFHNLLENLLNTSSVPLKFHIIVDNASRELALDEISDVVSHSNKVILYQMYDVEVCANAISDIVKVMTPHFSSRPGTYYSDALFYISLGLYRIAPESQKNAVLLDCDLYFKKDIFLLFKEFSSFKPTALFGLAPELSPVYRHVLQAYKVKHKTTFGEYYKKSNSTSLQPHPHGFQGYNSGVVLVNLSAIRKSKEYANIIQNGTIRSLTTKYKFRGHLGDQDFYTLVGFEYPHLIQTLNCGFNRQLCVWWRDHSYKDVFDYYFKCDHPTVVLHGNCNTKIPN